MQCYFLKTGKNVGRQEKEIDVHVVNFLCFP